MGKHSSSWHGKWVFLQITLFAGVCILAAVVTPTVEGALGDGPNPEPAIRLYWIDAWGLRPSVFKGTTREVARILETVAVRASWGDWKDFLAEKGNYQLRVLVVLAEPHPLLASQRRFPMGMIFGNGRPLESEPDVGKIFVLVPNILRALGYGICPPKGSLGRNILLSHPRQNGELCRAIGRVIVHELIHLIDPSIPHCENTVMSLFLDQHLLLRPDLGLSESTDGSLRVALGVLKESRLADARHLEKK